MSSSSPSVVNARGVPSSAHLEAPNDTRSNRSDRSVGKGRRRRAAAEQRRIEQQRWGQFAADDESNDFTVAPPAVNRRRACRASRRRNLGQEGLDEAFNWISAEDSVNDGGLTFPEESELDVALALALSLSDVSSTSPERSSDVRGIDLTYENLVLLEDVKVVAPSSVVESFQELLFEEIKNQPLFEADSSGVCIVCQCEYEMAEKLIVLPCCHNFHHACGSKWLLNYSKLCPVCKHDVTE